MASFHIDNRLKTAGDIQLSYLFELSIPQINKLCETIKTDEDLIIKVRSASIPSRGIQPIESNFLGMRQFFAGKVTFSDSLSVTFEEFQDQKVFSALYEWSQKIFDVEGNSLTGGISKVPTKNQGTSLGLGYTTDIYLKFYKRDGGLMSKMVRFYNAWPSNISEVGLDMGGSDSVKYNVTFTYDRWELENTK